MSAAQARRDEEEAAQGQNLVGSLLMGIPGRRKSKQTSKYWMQKDASMNPAITVGDTGNLMMDDVSLSNFNIGSMTDEWSKYKAYLESKRVRVTPKDYQEFTTHYQAKVGQYGTDIANKFSAMKMRGVKDSEIRDLVANNPQFRDTLSKLGMVNPEVDAQFAPYLKAKGGLFRGLLEAAPEAGLTAAAFGTPLAGYAAYKRYVSAAKTPISETLRRQLGFGPAKRFAGELGKGKGIEKEVAKRIGPMKDPKVLKNKRASLKRAQAKVDALHTKTGALKGTSSKASNAYDKAKKAFKGKNFDKSVKGKKLLKARASELAKNKIAQTNLTKSQTALKKAQTIFKKTPKTSVKPVKLIARVAKKSGIKGVFNLLTKSVGKRAAMGLMMRAGLGTLLTGTGVGAAAGMALNATAAYQIARALGKALKEVEGDSTFPEKLYGKSTGSSTLKGSQF